MEISLCIREYNKKYENMLIDFLKECLPESGRILNLNGRHEFYQDIENYFVAFWCMFDNDKIVGTAAVKELDKFLTVKTLDESAVYEPYNGTRTFYKKEGFYPLEVFTTFWDEENPCLFMVKVMGEVE